MAKITESILLEKGLPKTNKLDQVKSLNLSRMSLKKQDLPVPLLCKLSSLEQLDLSGNMLQELPAGLYLPSLRLLDCSNNNMEDVTSLEALDNLEELRVEDNLYLTVNDEHKVIFLLPRLRRFNGKDIRVMADHIHCVNDEILKKRVIALWEKDFSLPSPLTTQSLSTVEKKFVNAACFQVKYGPSSLNEYTKWRVKSLILSPPPPLSSGLLGQEPACLQPLHVLQCHSRQDSPEDFSTQLWACAFEPQHGWTQTVATCGGESICVIDCESGHVLKKYKVPGEMFYTLAWTTVLMSREGTCVRPCSVLAAGGTRGVVRLIHPRANLAYGKFRVGRRPISILRFCPRRGNFLFTGTYDKKIVMWDIGGLDRDYNFKTSQLLVLQTGSTPLHLCLPPSSPDTHLLAGCDSGLYSFDIQLSKNTQKRTDEMEIVFTSYKESKTNDCHTIDGLSFLTDDVVASKSPTQGSIYLWSWSGTRASQRGQQKEVPAQILAELQWSSTDIPYLSLNTCPSFGYVVCGDEDGRLWTYHISDSVTATFKTGKVPATEV
uniref:Origin recognition complex-associated protein n=1 Tax=Electrophorus electricus TaxID=8005 RepID=A0AAY5F5H2_ELEEL